MQCEFRPHSAFILSRSWLYPLESVCVSLLCLSLCSRCTLFFCNQLIAPPAVHTSPPCLSFTFSLSAYHSSPVTHRQIVVSRPRLIAKHFQISVFLCLGITYPYVSLPTNSLPSHQPLPAAVSSTICRHPTSHATFRTSFPNHSSPPLPGC